MFRRLCAAVLAALILAAATACGGNRIFGKQYEYEEDLTLSLDGSATLVVNASLPSLVALRGLPLPTDGTTRLKNDEIRALFASPVAEVTRVSPPWRRKGRRFIQIRMKVSDVRRLHEITPFAWSKYSLTQENGQHVFRQQVAASALRPGSLQNYGWDGREIVAFRLHLPSKILYHNARDVETNETTATSRGNILAWEQHLADRLDGRPVELEVRMESRSILHRTLFIFGGAFAAAVIVLLLLVWWTMRKGRSATTGLFLVAALLPLSALAQTPRTGRPNIVYIMTDDHAAHAIGAYGSRVNKTRTSTAWRARGRSWRTSLPPTQSARRAGPRF